MIDRTYIDARPKRPKRRVDTVLADAGLLGLRTRDIYLFIYFIFIDVREIERITYEVDIYGKIGRKGD